MGLDEDFNRFADEQRFRNPGSPMAPREASRARKVTSRTISFPAANFSRNDPAPGSGEDRPVKSALWAAKYKYLVICDWDGPLQNAAGVHLDYITADGTKHVCNDWPAASAPPGTTDNPGGNVDGHTAWVLVGKGTNAKCVSATGNFINASDNYAGVSYLGHVMSAQDLWDTSRFSLHGSDPLRANDGTTEEGDFSTEVASVICNQFSDANGENP